MNRDVPILVPSETDAAWVRDKTPDTWAVACDDSDASTAGPAAGDDATPVSAAVAIVPPQQDTDATQLVRRFAQRALPVIAVLPKSAPVREAVAHLDAGACQVLREPVVQDALELAVAHACHRADAAREPGDGTVPVNGTYREMLRALGSALDTRDPETQEHAIRVVRHALKLGEAMGMSGAELTALERGAILHDVGKIGVPDGILMKPNRLSDAEWHCMRSHPEIGFDMLSSISFLADALPIIRYHHERYDGTGYPDGLAGDEIPLGARIFAVVDALDAMTSDRPYRRATSVGDAVGEIERCAGTHFDPNVAAVLVGLVRSGDWPAGE